MSWTLDDGTTNQSLALWGFSQPVLDVPSQQRSTLTVFQAATDLTAAPPIAFGTGVKLKQSGSQVWVGKQVEDRPNAVTGESGRHLVFADAWWDLENLIFQQTWKDLTTSPPPVTDTYFSRLVLFQDLATGGYITNGAQMIEVINYAISCGVNLQLGTVDLAFYLPFYPVKAMSCAEVLKLCLRPTPDAVTWIDYTTTPPTFNCRQRASLTSKTLPYADGVKHSSSHIRARYDLQAPSVVIQYQKTNNYNGTVWTAFGVDAYPLLSTGQNVGALVVPIDLRGATRSDITVAVRSRAFDPTESTLSWWKEKKPDLSSIQYVGTGGPGFPDLVFGSVTITDDDGNSVDPAVLPYEHLEGEILPWMTTGAGGSVAVVAKTVTISGQFTYTRVDSLGRTLHTAHPLNPHNISVRVKLTNSPPDTQVYSALESSDPGDTAPTNLAQFIYNSLHTLAYEGEHVIVEADVTDILGPQYKLNLSGGATAWASMDATIQHVRHELHPGRTTVSFGPPAHIQPGDLVELLNLFRFRSIISNPQIRVTAERSTDTAALGGHTNKENTSADLVTKSVHTVTAPASASDCFIVLDAENQKLTLQILGDDGIPETGQPAIVASLQQLTGTNKLMTIREIQFNNKADSCRLYRMFVLATDPEPVA